MQHRGRASLGPLPDDIYLSLEPWLRIGRPPRHDVAAWNVTDDWPEQVPVPDAEVAVFEAWFGDLFDELFGSCR
ncbi:MAG: hypothetical protein ACREFN_14550 [Acetobacteraceae bacterium]